MLRKLAAAVVLLPLAVVIILFAVANRQWVTVSFDPLVSVNPAYAVSLPLFLLIFIALIAGVLVGGIAAWLRQARWRRAARRLEREVQALQDEVAAQRRQLVEQARAASPGPSPAIPPPTP